MSPLVEEILLDRVRVADAYKLTSPAPVVKAPGVERLPPSERRSILPLSVVMLSEVKASCVPAIARIEVSGPTGSSSSSSDKALASRIVTCVPVDTRATWPVKSLLALPSKIDPVPPLMVAIVAEMPRLDMRQLFSSRIIFLYRQERKTLVQIRGFGGVLPLYHRHRRRIQLFGYWGRTLLFRDTQE